VWLHQHLLRERAAGGGDFVDLDPQTSTSSRLPLPIAIVLLSAPAICSNQSLPNQFADMVTAHIMCEIICLIADQLAINGPLAPGS
jgi:hypothetical protein